jgi:BirA family transcriptional regulator, biotin operon repressor / biotin---[acetyl-CoA-carboxylase] ligase
LHNLNPNTLFVGKHLVYLPTCHSTNAVAAELIQSGKAFEGTLVVTLHQTAGRGQRGNTWEAAPGQNLTFSLVLNPTFVPVAEQYSLNIAIAVGVFEFLTKIFEEGLKIKWPNDIYYNNKKLGGILIENTVKHLSLQHSIVGIGLNINQKEFAEGRAVSLSQLAGQDFELVALLPQLLESLEKSYLQLRQGQISMLKHRYLQNLYKYQEKHLFEDEAGNMFAGIINGVDPYGRLAVEVKEELKYYSFKEIKFL